MIAQAYFQQREMNCLQCGWAKIAKRPWAKYCSGRCRTRAWRARNKPVPWIDSAIPTIARGEGKEYPGGFPREAE